MHQSLSSSEANSSSDIQQILRILLKPLINFHVHQKPAKQFNIVQTV